MGMNLVDNASAQERNFVLLGVEQNMFNTPSDRESHGSHAFTADA